MQQQQQQQSVDAIPFLLPSSQSRTKDVNNNNNNNNNNNDLSSSLSEKNQSNDPKIELYNNEDHDEDHDDDDENDKIKRLADYYAFQVLYSCDYFSLYPEEKTSHYFHLLEQSLDIRFSNTGHEEDYEEEDTPPYLGKCTQSFTSLFYQNLGQLLIRICRINSSTKMIFTNPFIIRKDHNTDILNNNNNSNFFMNAFSFNQHDYTVRMIHIIHVFMNQLDLLDVVSPSAAAAVVVDSSFNKSRDRLFLDHFLVGIKECSSNNNNNDKDKDESNDSSLNCNYTVSILRAFFQQYYSLPQLEMYIHEITRTLRNSILQSQNMIHTTTMFSNTNIGVEKRVQYMEQLQSYQNHLDQELQQHIYELEYIITSCYKINDLSIRSTCRLFIGNFLISFINGITTRTRSSTMRTKFPSLSLSQQQQQQQPPVYKSYTLGGDFRSSSIIIDPSRNIGIEDTQATGIHSMLRILLRILKGIPFPSLQSSRLDMNHDNTQYQHQEQQQQHHHQQEYEEICISSSLQSSHIDLLFSILLPLHKPSSLVLWRDQTPILELYHEPLVQCIGTLIVRDPTLLPKVLGGLIHPDIWPSEGSGMSSTSKMVLLLHEMDTYISLLHTIQKQYYSSSSSSSNNNNNNTELFLYPMFSQVIAPLSVRLGSCISSDNSRTSERALQFFKNPHWVGLVHFFFSNIGHSLVRSLVRLDSGMDLPWNPTVRKMTLLVLRELEAYNSTNFRQVCDGLFVVETSRMKPDPTLLKDEYYNPPTSLSKESKGGISSTRTHASTTSSHKYSSSLEGEVPVPRNRSVSRKEALTENMERPTVKKQMQIKVDSSNNPPLTITGVAPWAMNVNKEVQASTIKHTTSLNAISKKPVMDESSWRKVIHFMKQLEDKNDSVNESSDKTDLKYDSMGDLPILLPNLKFHDLVFGHELGKGAFSTVKYAKLILKDQKQSTWPEYAVKIVSTRKIQELGYESSISREIGILQSMSHPCIARLVSSFRFRDGSYLILEYASGGDLHSLLKRSGSLDVESTRFICGELVSALYYIHQQGFVYNDLKPENVLLTKCGHIKLTDFGACRPCTVEAQQSLKKHGRHLYLRLRDGDWKTSTQGLEVTMGYNLNTTDSDNNDDYIQELRIEGTTAYLPPEVVLGAIPTQASDSWALGCVTFYCSQGRPPMLDDDDVATRQKIVTFDFTTIHEYMPTHENSTTDHSINTFISKLLRKDPMERLKIEHAVNDDFFCSVNVLNLHKCTAPSLNVGIFAPAVDAKWNRRQFSSIWAPQPHEYKMTESLTCRAHPAQHHDDIPELNESGSMFTNTDNWNF